ncbi:hypothetical protein L3049_03125 [Labilibaculum sp. DW002]|uniref:Uncharacterized protein n=1 Tax=Paralabilibaculum antarcticum TaxID=2912572 RepID=A0ABT5VNW8_9BACT|nr:hypothetical protein [Labilibaculum sp. DW002]MDE5416987.1 hypothetical protein [Labilibaculum sp. DW002]
MERIRKIIATNLTGKKVLLLFLLTNIVYAVMLTVTIPKTMTFSNGLKLLDMMPLGYDLEYINTLFETLGENGRQVYLTNQLPVDMIYPFLFGISYCLLIGFFLKKLNKLDSFFFYLCFLPLIAGIADYLENFGIFTMLYNFPDFSPFTAKVTNVFSVVKSMTTTVFFIALIITLLMLGISKIKERRKTSANTV